MSVEFIHGDSLDWLKKMEDNSVQLALSSPPYCLDKKYEPFSEIRNYQIEMHEICKEVARVVSGSICWQVGNYVDNGEIIPLDYFYYPIFVSRGFKLRNRIIWRFGHGLHCSKRFSGRYEVILWMTKENNYTFNLDPVRVPQKYPSKKHFKGPKKGQLSGNPLGCSPNDVWEFLQKEWDSQIWDIPNVKSNHPEKTVHPCQFPLELAERCILALTNEGDTVLDPFGGVGSSVIAAAIHNRHGISIDKELEYIQFANKRYEEFNRGELSRRPFGKPIFNACQIQKSSTNVE
jgi:adenine-specific DNA-methyltransferase